jgi:hypothetical protein
MLGRAETAHLHRASAKPPSFTLGCAGFARVPLYFLVVDTMALSPIAR